MDDSLAASIIKYKRERHSPGETPESTANLVITLSLHYHKTSLPYTPVQHPNRTKMRFFTSIIALTAIIASAEACQCYSPTGVAVRVTEDCCRNSGGTPDGNQCPAHQIRKKLSTFSVCCKSYGYRSDCRCPRGC